MDGIFEDKQWLIARLIIAAIVIGSLLIGGTLTIREVKTTMAMGRLTALQGKLNNPTTKGQARAELETVTGRADRSARSQQEMAAWDPKPKALTAETVLIHSYDLRCADMPQGLFTKPCVPQGVFVGFDQADRVIWVEDWIAGKS